MKTWLREHFYIFLAINAATIFLSNDMFLPAISTIAKTYRTSTASISFGIAAFIIGGFLFQLFSGPIADRYGYKRSLLASSLFFIFATVGIVLSKTLLWFLFFRVLQGMGTCMIPTAGFAAINEYYEDKKAVLALAVTTSIVFISPVAGPIVGASILAITSWRGIFEIDIVVLLCSTILLFYFMPNVRRRNAGLVPPSFISGFQSIFIALKNKKFVYNCIALGLFGSTLSVWITASPHMLIENFHLSPQHYAWEQTPVLLCFLFGNAISPRLIKNTTSTQVLKTIMIFLLVYSILVCSGYLIFNFSSIFNVLFTLCSLFFIRGLTQSIQMQLTLSLERTSQGSSSALLQFINRIFAVTGSVFVSIFYSFSNLFYVELLFAIAILGSIATLLATRYSFATSEQVSTK